MQPYYEAGGITIYNADCRDVLPTLRGVDLVLADPPYPDYYTEIYQQTDIACLGALACRQFVFWSAKCAFPLDYTAVHIWDKQMGVASQYERIFERNGGKMYRVYRNCPVTSTVAASLTRDVFTGHPSQKPGQLIRRLITDGSDEYDVVLDPFMGSGTTLRAAKDLGRRAVGIEIEERWCDLAARRLQQEVMELAV